MKSKLALLAGIGIGYVLGSKAGRKAYTDLRDKAAGAWRSPQVQRVRQSTERAVADKAPALRGPVSAVTGAVDAAASRPGAEDREAIRAAAEREESEGRSAGAGEVAGSGPETSKD